MYCLDSRMEPLSRYSNLKEGCKKPVRKPQRHQPGYCSLQSALWTYLAQINQLPRGTNPWKSGWVKQYLPHFCPKTLELCHNLVVFLDLKSAFDSFVRQALWRCLTLEGVPPKLMNLLKALYADSNTQIDEFVYQFDQLSCKNEIRISSWPVTQEIYT